MCVRASVRHATQRSVVCPELRGSLPLLLLRLLRVYRVPQRKTVRVGPLLGITCCMSIVLICVPPLLAAAAAAPCRPSLLLLLLMICCLLCFHATLLPAGIPILPTSGTCLMAPAGSAGG